MSLCLSSEPCPFRQQSTSCGWCLFWSQFSPDPPSRELSQSAEGILKQAAGEAVSGEAHQTLRCSRGKIDDSDNFPPSGESP
jgi:hypothetical protein